MAGNINPIYSRAGQISSADITNSATALVTSNGAASTGITTASGEMFVVLTADATNGSYVDRIRIRVVATSANTSTSAVVVLRLYTSSVSSGATTSANTDCFEEIAVPVQTAASSTAATYPIDVPCKFILPAGKTILASVHTKPAANTEIQITAFAGNY